MSLPVIIGAGAAAGAVLYGLDRHERHRQERSIRSRDDLVQQLLMQGGAGQRWREVEEAHPLQSQQWLLLLSLGEVNLPPRLQGKPVQVRAKYGKAGYSLRRQTPWVRCHGTSAGTAIAELNDTFVFLWSDDLVPLLRLRLLRLGRRLPHTVARKEVSMSFRRRQIRQEAKVELLDRMDRIVGKLQLTVELLDVSVAELASYGFTLGRVVPSVGLDSMALPLIQGVPVEEAAPRSGAANGLASDSGDPDAASYDEPEPIQGRLVPGVARIPVEDPGPESEENWDQNESSEGSETTSVSQSSEERTSDTSDGVDSEDRRSPRRRLGCGTAKVCCC